MPAETFAGRPLLVVALGGNALSPPDGGDAGYDQERRRIEQNGSRLRALVARGWRLLVVHGNGPQVGRLLAADVHTDLHNLDVHTAQTQGELGYLISQSLPDSIALTTRVEVGTDPGPPVKAIGPVLDRAPASTHWVVHGNGFRAAVPSPRPVRVYEMTVIRALLDSVHVIAGGGGGIALDPDGRPVAGVIDKDRTAALLAIRLDAERFILATDVEGVYQDFGTSRARRLDRLRSADAQMLLETGALGAGSMAPKVEAAIDWVRATGRSAVICGLDQLDGALDNAGGTRISP